MVLFSSILSIFPQIGQADYSSANAYMDSYAAYRNMSGLKTVTINWPVWMETGMSVDFKVDFENSIFKPLKTKDAVLYLKEILKSGFSNILPAEINYLQFMKKTNFMLFKLSDKILSVIRKYELRNESRTGGTSETEVTIKGKESNKYSDVESVLAHIWSDILGIKEIDIYDTLSNLGGDSMIAIELHKKIDKEYPGIIDIADIFSYPSINQISEYIKSRLNLSQETDNEDSKITDEKKVDEKLKNIIDSIEFGDSTIENALNQINEIE